MRESLRLIIVLGLIATLSGGVLAYVHQTMSPIIEKNKELAMGEAILEVMPGAVSYEILTRKTETGDADPSGTVADTTTSATAADATSGGTTDATSSGTVDTTSAGTVADTTTSATATDATDTGTMTDGTSGGTTDGTSGSSVVVNVITIYRGMDDAGKTTGIAFAVDGNGFGGPIRLMVGLDPATRRLNRVKVLDHLETPGLGARITEQTFLGQFESKSLDDAFTAKGDVDAITGATVSSQAVAATIKTAISEIEADLRAGGIW